ncbi:hypothetical protein Tco_0365262 [Tanacetum coccineum]
MVVGIKSILNAASITDAHIRYKVNATQGVNAASEEVSTAELLKEFDLLKWDQQVVSELVALETLLKDMDQDFVPMVAASKVPMLKPENGATLPKTAVVEGVEKVMLITSAEDKRNKADLDTMSMDDLYNNLKVYEPEVKGVSSSSLSTQDMAFVSSSNNNTNSTNETVNIAHGVSTASTQVNERLPKGIKRDNKWTREKKLRGRSAFACGKKTSNLLSTDGGHVGWPWWGYETGMIG